MLKQTVLYSGICLLLSSALLFAAGARLQRRHWLLSLALIAALATAGWGVEAELMGGLPFLATVGTGIVGGVLVTAGFPAWNACGHAAFTAIAGAVAAFLSYAAYVLFSAQLGPWSLAFASLVLLLQIGTLVLLVANMHEILDVICRVEWKRQHGPCPLPPGYEPKVSIHVPIHAEPPDLVIETLNALARMAYSNYEVLVIDNNTAEESLWRPVETHCQRLGERFRFFHLLPWPGYKSGALNYALSQTAADAEVIGVVDADYVVEPRFLSDLCGYFRDERVAFVQTPQDYRDQLTRGRFGRALYLAYLYFFQVSMATRSEHNGIIYAGTMGLIRRSALDALGGWDEWCVTEDAEISLRLLNAGYESIYVAQTYGRGIMPLDYAGLKKQRFRWAFGGMQILRKHASLLFNPWSDGKLTLSQRLAYLNGGLQWLNDPMTVAFTALLLLGATALLLGKSLQSLPLAGAVILMPPLFILLAIMRFVWAFRLRAKCSLQDALDALVILLGLTWVVALACGQGLVSRQGMFLRTPKQLGRPRPWDALRIVAWEQLLGAVCLGTAVALALAPGANALSAWSVVVVLLLWQTVIYFSAVRSSAWSFAESQPRRQAPAKRRGRLITELRAATILVVLLAVTAALFFVGRERAPLLERVQWADPQRQFIPTRSLIAKPDPAAQIVAVVLEEADAARRGDVGRALQLWAADGTIVDAAQTGVLDGSDRVWSGAAQLRARYVREFQQRRYESLQHLNIRVAIDGDTAIVTSDLSAAFWSGTTFQRVKLRDNDRWTLRRDAGQWRIVRLEVNRAGVAVKPVVALTEESGA